MGIWVEGKFTIDQWLQAKNAFENIYLRFGGPENMMLVIESLPDGLTERLIAHLPDAAMLAVFDGFQAIDEDQIAHTTPSHAFPESAARDGLIRDPYVSRTGRLAAVECNLRPAAADQSGR